MGGSEGLRKRVKGLFLWAAGHSRAGQDMLGACGHQSGRRGRGSRVADHVFSSRKWGRAQQPQPLGTQPWVGATIPRTCHLPSISRPGPRSSAGCPPGVPAGAAKRPERTGEGECQWPQREPGGRGPCKGLQVIRAGVFPPPSPHHWGCRMNSGPR